MEEEGEEGHSSNHLRNKSHSSILQLSANFNAFPLSPYYFKFLKSSINAAAVQPVETLPKIYKNRTCFTYVFCVSYSTVLHSDPAFCAEGFLVYLLHNTHEISTRKLIIQIDQQSTLFLLLS